MTRSKGSVLASSLVLVVALPTLVANAPRPDAFAYGWPVILEGGGPVGYHRLAMSREVLAASRSPELADVVVFDDDDRPVPSFVRAPQELAPPPLPERPIQVFGVAERAREATTASLTLETRGQAGSRAVISIAPGSQDPDLPNTLRWYAAMDGSDCCAALRFGWDDAGESFISGVDIDQSDDLENWFPIARGAIAALRSGTSNVIRDRIEIPQSVLGYLRITVHQPAAGFRLARLTMEPRSQSDGEQVNEYGQPVGSQREWQESPLNGDAPTILDLGATLSVDRFEVNLTESGMVRARLESASDPAGPWTARGEALFFRFESAEGSSASDAAMVGGTAARHWRAVLTGYSGAPATLRLGWVASELVFVGQGRPPYRVVAGNAIAAQGVEGLQAMRSDARALWQAQKPYTGLVTLGPRKTLAGDAAYSIAPPPRDWRRVLLWLLLAGGVAAVLAMAWRLRRELTPAA